VPEELSGQRACQHAQLGRPELGPAVQLMQGSSTPLTRSLVHALQTMATLLFASVEEINALGPQGQNALHFAAKQGHEKITRLIVSAQRGG
jgi:ankyrin repeat protein